MLRIGFDLDGTLDCPEMAEMIRSLLNSGADVHIITAIFSEAGNWQSPEAKFSKLSRLGIPYMTASPNLGQLPLPGTATLHILTAMGENYDRAYRLADLGLRKGALCEQLGLTIYVEDSELFCEMIPKMSRGTRILQVK